MTYVCYTTLFMLQECVTGI